MALLPRNKSIKTRTEREDQAGKVYVLAAGAPNHYIGGFGVVGPGDFVTLPEGTEPGKWLIHVADSDVAKVQADPSLAPILAEAAAKLVVDETVVSDSKPADPGADSKESDAAAKEAAAAAKESAAKAADAAKDESKK